MDKKMVELYKKKLRASELIYKYAGLPAIIISGVVLLHSIVVSSPLFGMWLMIFMFNAVNMFGMKVSQRMYRDIIDLWSEQERAQRVADLNPHRK